MIGPTQGVRRAAYETIASHEHVPTYSLVPLRGPKGETLTGYRGVQRDDTGSIVSVVSARYGLVGHRAVAEAVHRVGEALGVPGNGDGSPPVIREGIRLYCGGRRMEVKLVVGRRFRLCEGEELYPGLRVLNSLDGSWAIRLSGFAVRIACENQLYAGQGNLVEWRELHLVSQSDLLSELGREIHALLGRFAEALALYRRAMREEILATEVGPALQAQGLPRRHAEAIGGRVEAEASHVTLTTRWTAYQTATAYLTRELTVNPDREREFERAAARALLLP